MKKCNFVLPVKLSGITMSDVEKVTFKFQQGDVCVLFSYPSDSAVYDSTNQCINLIWSASDAFKFAAGKTILMDTLVKLTGVETNPETNIVKLSMSDTLFTEQEVEDNG